MDFHGNINLRNNEMQRMVLQVETVFPETPVVGRLVFKNKRVYICVELIGGVPAWVPLTNFVDTYIYDQVGTSATWTVVHNLNTTNPLIQVYDDDLQLTIPEMVTPIDNNTIEITFGTAIAGRAIAMKGMQADDDLYGGTILPEPSAYKFTQSSALGTWVVRHKLGYYPIVTVFDENDVEIIPSNIVNDDIFQTTITFSSAVTGYARFV